MARARLEQDVIVLDSSDESDQSAKNVVQVATITKHGASYPQSSRREKTACHSGVSSERLTAEGAKIVAAHICSEKAVQNGVESVVSIDDEDNSQDVEIVAKQASEHGLERDPQMLVPESPELTPVPPVSAPAPADAIELALTAASEATLASTPTPTQTPLSKQEQDKADLDFNLDLEQGRAAGPDLDFAFSMPFSQTSVRDSHYSPERPQVGVYLDAQEH
ncbi:hypothetical protein LPJ56_003160, partial [Coemansia sp. RSA 2599]